LNAFRRDDLEESYMSRTLITALVFSFFYFVELFVFGIGLFKEGGGTGFGYGLLAALLTLWIGFFSIRLGKFQHETRAFLVFAVAVSFWVIPAWRVEMVVEEREYQQAMENLDRTEVSQVTDEPILASSGKASGIRMRYSIRFHKTGIYPPAPILTVNKEMFANPPMRVVRTEITPHPEEIRKDSWNTDTYGRYKGNVTYTFVVDLVPAFVVVSRDKTRSCFLFPDPDQRKSVASSDAETRFRVYIDGTKYGSPTGQDPISTSNAYRLRDFYESAVANGPRDTCVFDARGDVQ
jgi:hypothetical protein